MKCGVNANMTNVLNEGWMDGREVSHTVNV